MRVLTCCLLTAVASVFATVALIGHQTDLALDRAERAEGELAALRASVGLPISVPVEMEKGL